MADRIPSVDSVTKLFADSVRTALTTDILAGKAGSFSVKNYGAVGDGTTDDTAAIQAAFDACTTTSGNPRRGGEVVFPKGKVVHFRGVWDTDQHRSAGVHRKQVHSGARA